jgi:hypothetical protein
MKLSEAFITMRMAEEAKKTLSEFCIKKIPKTGTNVWYSFSDYRISGDNLIIDYNYGYGDMEFSDSVVVNMIEYIRDDKINDLINE